MDDYEKFATALLIVFGALIVGGMMALSIVIGSKPCFLFALGAGVLGWFSSFAVLFDKPRVYFWLIVAAIICIAVSIGIYVK